MRKAKHRLCCLQVKMKNLKCDLIPIWNKVNFMHEEVFICLRY